MEVAATSAAAAGAGEATPRRNPRRSSIPSRVIMGLDESFAQELESDDENFFGSDDESSAAPSPEPSHGEAEVPPEPDFPTSFEGNWSSDEEADESDAPATAAGAADASEVAESEISEVEALITAGCGCTGVEHMTVFTAQEFAEHRKRFRQMSSRERDIYLCGVLCSASRGEREPYHGGKVQDKDRERVTYAYSVMSVELCCSAFMKACWYHEIPALLFLCGGTRHSEDESHFQGG